MEPTTAAPVADANPDVPANLPPLGRGVGGRHVDADGAPVAPPPEAPPRPTAEVITAAADGKSISPREVADATEWLLSDDPWAGIATQTTLTLNLGTDERPKFIEWTVGSIDSDQLRNAQARARKTTRAANGEPDDYETHCWVTAYASTSPDVEALSKRKGHSLGHFVREAFKGKPGLVTQVAVEVMKISGFDDDDVQVAAGKG